MGLLPESCLCHRRLCVPQRPAVLPGILFCLLPTLFGAQAVREDRASAAWGMPCGMKSRQGGSPKALHRLCAIGFAAAVGGRFLPPAAPPGGMGGQWARAAPRWRWVLGCRNRCCCPRCAQKTGGKKQAEEQMNIIEIDHLTYTYPGAKPTLGRSHCELKKGTSWQSLGTTAAGNPLFAKP